MPNQNVIKEVLDELSIKLERPIRKAVSSALGEAYKAGDMTKGQVYRQFAFWKYGDTFCLEAFPGYPKQRARELDTAKNREAAISKQESVGNLDIQQMFKFFDLQACLKAIVFESHTPEVLGKYYNISVSELLSAARPCVEIRNIAFGHNNDFTFENQSVDDFKAKIIGPYKKLLNLFESNDTVKEQLREIGKLEEIYLGFSVSVSKVCQIYASSEDVVKKWAARKGFAVSGDVISDVSMAMIADTPWSYYREFTEIVTSLGESETPKMRRSYTFLKKDTLNGALDQDQLKEICGRFNVVIDSSILSNESFFENLINVIMPNVKSPARVLVCRATKYKLYTDEEATAIKNLENLTHERKVFYFDPSSSLTDENSAILSFIKYNANYPFCLFTSKKDLIEEAFGENNELRLTAIRSSADSILLWKKARGLFEGEEIISTGSRVLIDEKEVTVGELVGEGGEGAVFGIAGDNSSVIKIYNDNDKINVEKLNYIIRTSVEDRSICWPTALVKSIKGDVCGYVMPRSGKSMELGLTVLKMGQENLRKKYLPQWTRKDLAQLCISILDRFINLHSKGILMGDVNPRNILIDLQDSRKCWFVDCDSYQIGDYRCPVGTITFTSPRIYNEYGDEPQYSSFSRTQEDENYAVASLLFQILALGSRPFTRKGAGESDLIEQIRNCDFPYAKESDMEAPDGPVLMIWNNLSRELQDMFTAIFTGKSTYSDEEWKKALSSYSYAISQEWLTAELAPKKYKSKKEGQYTDFTCPGCGNDANMPAKKYKYLVDNKKLPLCNTCQQFGNVLWKRNNKVEGECENCGFIFDVPEYWHWMAEIDPNSHIYCRKCRGEMGL